MWAGASLTLGTKLVVGGALMGVAVDVLIVDFEVAQGHAPLVRAPDGAVESKVPEK